MTVLVEGAHPDLIVASGDLTNRGSVEELSHLKQAFESVEVPIFPHFGGHDGNEERFAGGDPSFIRNFEQLLGPTYFSFDWGGRHFAFYPTEDYFFSARDIERKEGWLRKDLEMQPEGREIVVVTHTRFWARRILAHRFPQRRWCWITVFVSAPGTDGFAA